MKVFIKNVMIIVMVFILLGTILMSAVGINTRSLTSDEICIDDDIQKISQNRHTLYVGGMGPNNYTKIQDAIDNASDGDTVFVYSGTYYENIVIYKSITLIGENKDDTVIDGNHSGNTIQITADYNTVRKFTIIGSSYACAGIKVYSNYNYICSNNISSNWCWGIQLLSSAQNAVTENLFTNNNCSDIELDSSTSNAITNNIITNSRRGIMLKSSDDNTVSDNTITDNSKEGIKLDCSSSNKIFDNSLCNNSHCGIRLQSSSSNVIIKNTIIKNGGSFVYYNDGVRLEISSDNNTLGSNIIDSNSGYGIYLYFTSNNTISNNTFINNSLMIWGNTSSYFVHNIMSNTVNGKPLYYYNNREIFTVPSDAGAVILVNCNSCNISGLNLSGGSAGLQLVFSNGNSIFDNIISYNRWGIYLKSSCNNSIHENIINCNSIDGIKLFDSSSNNIQDNVIIDNNWVGISLVSSSNNIVQDNSIINNTDGINLSPPYAPPYDLPNNSINNNHVGSSNNVIQGNTISGNNGNGIDMVDSNHNRIGDNIISDNGYGFILGGSNSNIINGNNISRSEGLGVYLFASDSNHIHYNNFINNSIHAFFANALFNYWSRNYWDDWIGLVPRPILGEIWIPGVIFIPWVNFDWCPLTFPYRGG